MEDLKSRSKEKISKANHTNTTSSVNSPHDRLFKTAMSNIQVAKDFFEHYLPETLRPHVDLNTLGLCPNSYVDQALKLSSSDVLYKVSIANNTGYLYLLCEHQSAVDNLMPFRIWQYIVAIWQDHIKQTKEEKLPLVIPLVFYHGPKPYDGPRDIRDLIQAPLTLIDETLFQAFHLVDTHHIADETLQKQHWAGVMAFTMKHIFARDFMVFIQPFIEMIRPLEQQAGATHYIVSLLKYLLDVGETGQPEVFADTLQEALSNQTRGEIMTVSEWLMIKAESNMLLRLLGHKFGIISPVYQKRIKEANSEQLLCWAERVLEVDSLEGLFGK